MNILGINHIGLAPKDPTKAKAFFETILGLGCDGEELVKDQKTLTTMFASSHAAPTSRTRLEILEDEPGETGPIGQFLNKRGSGIHHIAIQVDSIDAAIKHMQDHDVAMIDNSPRPGAHQTKIAFVHPKATGGLLVELVQES